MGITGITSYEIDPETILEEESYKYHIVATTHVILVQHSVFIAKTLEEAGGTGLLGNFPGSHHPV